ncbi:MAG: trehalose-6-phosphate synthase [Candidatus Nanopelagicales bacterium]
MVLANEVDTVTGYDFLVVCNRLPVEMHPDGQGKVTWTRSPGGLVAAMEPALRGHEAVWIGWSGHHIDDTLPVSPVPPGVGPCDLQEVGLSREDVEEYYEGFCNATIWPLYHDAVVTPAYHRRPWDRYVAVNRRFATTTARLAAPGATVWVHDYQLQLVPRMLRELRPDLVIGFFLHIPFPPAELFAQLPWRRQVVEGLLGADLVGFQTAGGAANFLALTSRLLGLSPDSDGVDVVAADGGTRRVKVGAFPISIDTAEYDSLARRPDVRARAAAIREAVGSPTHLLLGVDRLDYTKGIDVRLKAITELLQDGLVDDCVFIQVATPSRENVEDYQRMRDEIDQMVGRAIGDHGSIGAPPIQYLHQPLPREELVAYYVASDVMLVTPYRDGMNLVAKEYVACRTEGDGVLVLSEFTGAAIDLPHAFLVNPYDADGVKDAIIAAISVPEEDLRTRMAAMREQVFAHDVDRWAAEFLSALHTER